MPDPRLNCAARICCDPPEAREACIEILMDLGAPDRVCAENMATKMETLGIVFLSEELAESISGIVDYPKELKG